MDLMTIAPLLVVVAGGIIAAMVFYRLAPRLPWLGNGRYRAIIGVVAAAFAIIVIGWGVLRYAALHCGTYDLGNFDQVIWNTSQGYPFVFTVQGVAQNFLGIHFSPFLALLAPVYWVLADARVLMAVQVGGIVLGVLPIVWLARERLESRLAGVAFALGYFLLPSVQKIARYDVHPVGFAMPLLTFATYFMLKRRYLLFLIMLVLALLCKEDIGLTVAGIGLFLLLVQRRRWGGLVIAALGVTWTLVAIRWVIPLFRGGEEYLFVSRYTYLGSSVDEMLLTLFTRPFYVLEHVLIPEKVAFVLYMLVPLGFLPLVGFEVFALALPTFGYLLLSDSPAQYTIRYHYPAPLIPFIFLGAVIGLGRLSTWWSQRRADDPDARRKVVLAGAGFLVVAGILNALFYSPPWLSNLPGLIQDLPRGTIARQGMEEIPPSATVVAQTNLVPQVSHRRYIYTFPDVPDLSAVDYILLDREGAIFPLTSHDVLYRALERFQRNPFLELYYQENGFRFFRKAQASMPNPMAVDFDHALMLLGFDTNGQPLTAGQSNPVTLYWQAPRSVETRYSVYLHLLDADGERWVLVDQEPGQGRFPTTDWLLGETLRETYALAVPVGTPPGVYTLLVGLRSMASNRPVDVLGEDGQLQGPDVMLPVSVVRPTQPPNPDTMTIQRRLDRTLGDDLQLLGYDLDEGPYAPGTSIPLRLYWQARRDVDRDYLVIVRLWDGAGQLAGGTKTRPAHGRSTTTRWRDGDVTEDRHLVALDARLPSGTYTLTVAIADKGSTWTSEEVILDVIPVQGRPRVFEPPPIAYPQVVSLGTEVRLLGYELASPTVHPGQALSLTLQWQCQEPLAASYAVFTHLVDEKDNIWGQRDGIPCGGQCPTMSWLPGEVLTDPYQIVVRSDAPPGTYRIAVGLYDPRTGARLARADGQGDRILLDTVIQVQRP